jgi:predicted TIM-barrel fold metal-dependent hydrolase
VSIEPDEAIANNVITQVGNGNLVFSTDYPHVDSRYPEAVNHFLRLPLSEGDKRKILWDNCASYYAM